MNVSASALDLLGLASGEIAPLDPAAVSPGFAPSRSKATAAETFLSLISALDGVVQPEKKSGKQEDVPAGVAAPVPAAGIPPLVLVLPVGIEASASAAPGTVPEPQTGGQWVPVVSPSMPFFSCRQADWTAVDQAVPQPAAASVDARILAFAARLTPKPAPATIPVSTVSLAPEPAPETVAARWSSPDAKVPAFAAPLTHDPAPAATPFEVPGTKIPAFAAHLAPNSAPPTTLSPPDATIPALAAPAAAPAPPPEPKAPASAAHLASDPAAKPLPDAASGDTAQGEARSPAGPRSNEHGSSQQRSDTRPNAETAPRAEAAVRSASRMDAVAPALSPPGGPSAAPDPPRRGPQNAGTGLLEPEAKPAPPAAPAGEARTISLRVSDAGQERVELKVTDRAGDVRVAVRTADANLAGSLRDHLGELVQRLEQTGFRAETWRPAQAGAASMDSRQTTRRPEGEAGASTGSHAQDPSGGRQQKQPDRARWIQEIEDSMENERSVAAWLQASIR